MVFFRNNSSIKAGMDMYAAAGKFEIILLEYAMTEYYSLFASTVSCV